MTDDPVGAIILAGGTSSRMGQDKAMLTHNGMTFLEHTICKMLTVATDIIVVVDTPDKYSIPCGRLLADLYPDTGPVGGILTGLMALPHGYHYVVACDMPDISVAVLELLYKAATLPYDAILPEINGFVEPLCGVYSHTAKPKLMAFLESGKRAAREAVSLLSVKRVGEGVLRRVDPECKSFENINTMEDLARFQQRTRFR